MAVWLAVALAVAILVARRMQQQLPAKGGAGWMVDAVLLGLLAARIAFVLRWWPQYRDDLTLVLRVGDGGYTAWVGVAVGLLWLWWRTRQATAWRRPLAAGVVAGALAWTFLAGSVALMQASVRLPDAPLTALDGRQIRLRDLQDGPVVVNIWATWCPPCRREMPMLAQAQRNHPGVVFVFVNQAETPGIINAYLDEAGLHLDNVLIDRLSGVMQATGSRGLPTTLFFDAWGQLVDTHMGELSPATMAHKLQRLD